MNNHSSITSVLFSAFTLAILGTTSLQKITSFQKSYENEGTYHASIHVASYDASRHLSLHPQGLCQRIKTHNYSLTS